MWDWHAAFLFLIVIHRWYASQIGLEDRSWICKVGFYFRFVTCCFSASCYVMRAAEGLFWDRTKLSRLARPQARLWFLIYPRIADDINIEFANFASFPSGNWLGFVRKITGWNGLCATWLEYLQLLPTGMTPEIKDAIHITMSSTVIVHWGTTPFAVGSDTTWGAAMTGRSTRSFFAFIRISPQLRRRPIFHHDGPPTTRASPFTAPQTLEIRPMLLREMHSMRTRAYYVR